MYSQSKIGRGVGGCVQIAVQLSLRVADESSRDVEGEGGGSRKQLNGGVGIYIT